MEYIPVVLSGIAALIALLESTWNSNGSGFKKLTTPGRWALSIIVMTFIYSTSSTYIQRQKLEEVKQDEERISKIIGHEINRATDHLLEPFRLLYIEYDEEDHIDTKRISIEMLLQEENIKKAQSMCLQNRPTSFSTVPDSGNWNDIFRTQIMSGINRLERLIDRYSSQMDSNLLGSIHSLIEDGYFTRYAFWLKEEGNPETGYGVPKCAIGQAIGSHKKYLVMINRIIEENETNVFIR